MSIRPAIQRLKTIKATNILERQYPLEKQIF
jgi:hypothetical protein